MYILILSTYRPEEGAGVKGGIMDKKLTVFIVAVLSRGGLRMQR